MNCRLCAAPLCEVFLDLGAAPPSNAFLSPAALARPETYFPLKLFTCTECFLVQVDEVQSHTALFVADYAYYSSFSRSWLAHAQRFVGHAVEKLGLDERSLVVEVASNDGYLLQYMAERRIPCVGIEPTKGTADAARAKGIDTVCEFFGEAFARRFARERGSAHLVVANNVLAHVPDLHDFVAGLASVLAPNGVISVEFPHLQRLVAERQFDTVYHEHFSYFSLHTVHRAFAAHGLRIWDVEHLSTHGGSLRVWASHMDGGHADSSSVAATLADEAAAGMLDMSYYHGFQIQADAVKNEMLEFLLKQRRHGRKVAAYGAAAKGNTLLNYAGVKPDLIPMVADTSPHKQGRFMPGSRIPIVTEATLREFRPDFVIVFPWNLLHEISSQLKYIRDWGGRFVTVIPELTLL